jgi:hypothetical protein
MTYALAWPLQEAVYAALTASPEVAALSGGRIYDATPAAAGPAEDELHYVVLGDESVTDWSAADCAGAQHLLLISVYAAERSFSEAKRLAGAISERLCTGPLPMSRGRVVSTFFAAARTRREERDRVRRIELRFRVLVEDAG